MQLISKCNKEIRFLLCVFDIFTKYAWLVLLKVKEGVAIVNAFQRMSDDLKRKSYKILRKICFYRKTYRNFKE